MPKRPALRAATGNRRRRAKRGTSLNRRTMGLSHKQVGFMIMLHQKMTQHLFGLVVSIIPLYFLIGAHTLLAAYPQLFPHGQDAYLQLRFARMTCISIVNTMFHYSQYVDCYRLDYLLYDITPDEEEEHVGYRPSREIRFHSWTNQECYENTGFTKVQLFRIYNCFGLQNIANDNDGVISVPSGAIRASNGNEMVTCVEVDFDVSGQQIHECNWASGFDSFSRRLSFIPHRD